MGTVTALELRDLVTHSDHWCVSLYLPTLVAGRDGLQDAVRLKNLVAAAHQQLIDKGVRSVAARKLLAPLLELPFDPATWERRRPGLAAFRSRSMSRDYWLATPPEETVIVDRRFHVKQLLPALDSNLRFYLLALSRNQVRFLDATKEGFELVDVPDLPKSIDEALNLQGADRGEQVHSGAQGSLGKEAGVFHGQGGCPDTLKDDTTTYLRLIEASLRTVLSGQRDPLILAGVEYEVAMFRKLCTYPYVSDRPVFGGFDYVTDQQLHARGLLVAQQIIDDIREERIANYRDAMNAGKSSDNIQEIVTAAHQGRIEMLLVEHRDAVFGRIAPDGTAVEIVDERDPALDLVEIATAQTLLHGGDVYSATRDELPTPGPLRAVFRY